MAPINERLEQLAAQVARDKGVEVAPLRSVLVKLGERGVPERTFRKRRCGREELIKLRAENDSSARPSALAAIAQEVQALIDKASLDDARTRWRVAARPPVRCGSTRAVTRRHSCAEDARVDDLQLAYRHAAAKYAEPPTRRAFRHGTAMAIPGWAGIGSV